MKNFTYEEIRAMENTCARLRTLVRDFHLRQPFTLIYASQELIYYNAVTRKTYRECSEEFTKNYRNAKLIVLYDKEVDFSALDETLDRLGLLNITVGFFGNDVRSFRIFRNLYKIHAIVVEFGSRDSNRILYFKYSLVRDYFIPYSEIYWRLKALDIPPPPPPPNFRLTIKDCEWWEDLEVYPIFATNFRYFTNKENYVLFSGQLRLEKNIFSTPPSPLVENGRGAFFLPKSNLFETRSSSSRKN